ncbi:MAG: BspA family leucine-rich repeat surface protein, partial [Butyrivibrio sp.]|nr:BspA family leucine-rich repeat surface protein [Butyrivibrio sp.]
MNRKRQRKSGKAGWRGRYGKQRVLALVLSTALVLGVCVPECGLTVQAAGTQESYEEEGVYAQEESTPSEELLTSSDATDVSEGDSVSENAVMVTALSSEEDNEIASGTYESISWKIDANGKLTVEGTGEFAAPTSNSLQDIFSNPSRAPWYSYRENIKSAVVNVKGMKDAGFMFNGCSNLESLDLSGFDTSNVLNMTHMFCGCSSLTSIDLSGLDTSNVTNMCSMFCGCSSLTSLDLSGFDTSSVTDMCSMFGSCSGLSSLDVSGFDTSSVIDMSDMFYGCSGLTSLDLSGFDTSNVQKMLGVFGECSGLSSLDLSGFDTGNVENMMDMFAYCSGLSSLDLSGFDTSSVIDMSYVFYHCSDLTSLDLNGIDTSNVESMAGMFYGCSSLTSLDLSSFDTGNVVDMGGMFYGCSSLTSLDLSSFDTGNVVGMGSMFYGCSSLTMLYTPYNISTTLSEDSLSLPVAEGDVWYDSTGATYTAQPTGLDHSIVLARNKIPDAMTSQLTARLSKSVYGSNSVVKPVDLTVKYRGTDGRTTVLPYKGEDSADGYTMSDVDMSTAGAKALTISYDNGTDVLTVVVTFTVRGPLTDSMVILPEAEYVYNGEPHQPLPVVKAADGTELVVGKDYTVSYTDNVNAGEATVAVKGRKGYDGVVEKNFTIKKATPEDVEVTVPELYVKSHENHTRSLSACFDKSAPNNGGITSYTLGEVTEQNLVTGGEGDVLSETPSIDENGILTYSTKAGTLGDSVLIPVTVTFAQNYNDALILVTVCLKDKAPVDISGVTVKNAAFNGRPVSPEGTAVVRAKGEAGEDVTRLVTLSYHYTGTQADGAAYDSDTAPTHAGSYVLTLTVEENDSYEGSAELPFEIMKAPLTVTVRDVKLVIGEFEALPDESTIVYDITGLVGSHEVNDVFDTQPVVYYGLNGEKLDKAAIAIDTTGSYELIPSGGELNRTIGSDYEIQSYKNGTLTITTNPDDGKFRVSEVSAQTYTGS